MSQLESVLAEVRQLCVREGLGYGAVANTPKIQWLRAVENELTYGHATDRVVAAHDYVSCVAASEKQLGPDYSRIASVLLNCDQTNSRTLSQRRADLMSEFRIGKDAFAREEKLALERLAGTLIGLSSSPCGEGSSDAAERATRAKVSWDALDSEGEGLKALMHGFTLLRLSMSDEEARRHADEILELLPRAVAYFGRSESDSRATLKAILEGVAADEYEIWASSIPMKPLLLGPAFLAEYLRAFDRISEVAEATAIASIRSSVGALETYGDLGVLHHQLARRPIRDPELTVKQFIDQTLAILLRIVMAFEMTNNWERISALGDGRTAALTNPIDPPRE